MKTRVYLGRDQHPGGYRRVFEIEGGLEVDENNFVEIERTRVYFDDVLGITYHRQTGIAFLITMGVLTLIFGGLALLMFLDDQVEATIAMGVVTAPFAIAFLVRVLLKVDIVTVFGRRTMACMRFPIRKGRARQIFRDLTLKIRAAQERAVAAQPAPSAPPEPPLPPPPPSP